MTKWRNVNVKCSNERQKALMTKLAYWEDRLIKWKEFQQKLPSKEKGNAKVN